MESKGVLSKKNRRVAGARAYIRALPKSIRCAAAKDESSTYLHDDTPTEREVVVK